MDFVRLLNEGRRSEPSPVSSGRWVVERAWYSLGDDRVPVIEKYRGIPSAPEFPCVPVSRQAERLRHFRDALGMETPHYVAWSGDPGMVRREERDMPGQDRLFLEDLTAGGTHQVLDLYGQHIAVADPACHLMRGGRIDRLMNREHVRETLASYMARLALDGLAPRADYFMVRVRKDGCSRNREGKAYVVDVEYEEHLGPLDPLWYGEKDLFLRESGISDPGGIICRMKELIREYRKEGIPKRRRSVGLIEDKL